ncbi:hypothetical protein Moror_14548 [Moniliophthora roreri MCA 2997]|uniref:Uncharacterized protein n=1 Tax=Moniliophthora roreri (strain MCA 2997) TaxID=1381753 RepID=V2XLC3_MONRO|nr:hypothetical protein Moror_14548 [Moniliophthora roreri MCA 2997]
MDTTLCNIPRDTVVDLDTDIASWTAKDRAAYLLYKNGLIISVFAPSVGAMHPIFQGLYAIDEEGRSFQLETIMRLLEDAMFKRAQPLYLTFDSKKQRYSLVPKRINEPYNITATLWLPKVQESEFQLIRYWGWGRSICVWKGRQIEVDLFWDSSRYQQLNDEMHSVKALSSLDLCFTPVAHVLRGKSVIGLAFERTSGRSVRYGDRKLVYAAVAKMHQHRVYFRGGYDKMMIAIDDGKVRFCDNLHCFPRFEGPISAKEVELEKKAWVTLNNMFLDLLAEPNPIVLGDSYIVEPVLCKYYQSDAEHPLNNPNVVVSISFPRYSKQHHHDLEDGYLPRRLEGAIRRRRPTSYHDQTLKLSSATVPHSASPHSVVVSNPKPRKHGFHPYTPDVKSTTSKALLSSACDASSSAWDDTETLVDETERIVEL